MKDTYQLYQEARDAAWRTLLRLEKKELPVRVHALLSQLRIPVLSFPDPDQEPRLAKLLQKAQAPFCVSLKIQGVWHIFLKKGCLDERQERFALAHELGHMILHHPTYALDRGVHAFRGRENAGDLLEDPEEIWDYAADIFAIRLLAPACVLHALYLDQPGAIASLCGLPPRAAALRAERMELLNQRDAFLSHPLEKQVYRDFSPFVQARRRMETPAKKEQPPRQDETPARVLLPEIRPARKKGRPAGGNWLFRLAPWVAAALGLVYLVMYLLWDS